MFVLLLVGLKRSPLQHLCGHCFYWLRLLAVSWMFSLFFFFFCVLQPFLLHPYLFSLGNLLFIQHYDRRGQYDISLSKIDEAIEHTPTVIDLYSVKVSLYIKLSFKLLILYIL